jgi:ActR/RegA family two-component response regulator
MVCSRFPLHDKHILIADDDHIVANDLAQRLAGLGAIVVTATTTEDALRQAHRHMPSFSVLDLELRGRETEPLRQTLYERRIPFLVYTACHHRPQTGRWAAMPLVYKPDECGEVGRAVVRLSSQPSPWPWPVS